jgi:ribosomal protein S18 acetylase RimI-like enzyme
MLLGRRYPVIDLISRGKQRAMPINYRPSQLSDVPAMAAIRAADWGTEEYWRERITQYLMGTLHPKDGLPPRVSVVALENERVVGLIAGHLTRRFGCDGELEWISVRAECRGRGIAAELLRRLAEWFIANHARYVCVDVEPSNVVARRFYARHGAEDLKPHWMVWKDIGTAIETRCG